MLYLSGVGRSGQLHCSAEGPGPAVCLHCLLQLLCLLKQLPGLLKLTSLTQRRRYVPQEIRLARQLLHGTFQISAHIA